MPVLAELTLPFCRVGGMVIVHKTEGAAEEIASAELRDRDDGWRTHAHNQSDMGGA